MNYEPKKTKAQKLGEGIGRDLNVLAVVFIVLKCTGLVTWSWAYTLWPIWIPLVVVLVLLLIVALLKAVAD